MKILGEKSLTTKDKIIKFFSINSYDNNTIKDLTKIKCEVYNINCCFKNNYFYLCENKWISSRKIIDALSQINQYCKDVKPYVQISCIDEDIDIIKIFIEQKAKWNNSFKKIIIL